MIIYIVEDVELKYFNQYIKNKKICQRIILV